MGGARVVGAKSQDRLHIFWLCRKPYFVHISFDLKKYEGDPLFPPEGESAQGVYPLESPSATWFNLMRGNRNMGDAQAVGQR